MLHLVDRSRILDQWSWCSRRRYLQYHSGPLGYGIRPKRKAIPLATGLYIHAAIADLLTLNKDDDRAGAREIIAKQLKRYREAVKAGFQGIAEQSPEYDFLEDEQASLIEGLFWGFRRVVLPVLRARFNLLAIEREEGMVVDCTCGLGEGVGELPDHEARDCEGTAVMSRPDLLVEDKVSGEVGNLDFKTSGDCLAVNFPDQFEDNVQLVLGSLGAEKRLGREISHCYILGLNKGWRVKSKLPEDFGRVKTGPRKQESVFCYAWKREANPPNWAEDWRWSFEYEEVHAATGEMKRHTLKGKGYDKAPIWTLQAAAMEGMSALEYWVEWLPEDVVAGEFRLLGPIPMPRHLGKDVLEAITHEERRNRERLWEVYEAIEAHGWTSAEVQSALNQHFPQSWDCKRYGGHCPMLKICKRDVGWEDPIGSGDYILRRPHHQPEVAQMLARGIEPPPEEWEEEGEGGR